MTDESKGVDRPRGILSPADRRLLRGEKEYEHRQSLLKRRATIRERVTNGLRDFRLLAGELDGTDRAKITDEIGMNKWADAPDHSLMAGPPLEVVHAITFLYQLHESTEAREPTEMFESVVRFGVSAALRKERGGLWDAPTDIDPRRVSLPDPTVIREKIRDGRGDELNGAESQWLVNRLNDNAALDVALTAIDAPSSREELQRGVREGKITLDRLKRLEKEGVSEATEVELIEADRPPSRAP